MKISTLERLPVDGISLDTETALIADGALAPDLVLGSLARYVEGSDDPLPAEILAADDLIVRFIAILEDPNTILTTANGAYDLAVMANECLQRGYDPMPLIFRLLDEGRHVDIQLVEALHAIAEGHLGNDPRTGRGLINPETKKKGMYSLATCVDLNLGRADAKKNDKHRSSYAEFIGVPLSELPIEATEYPKDDVRNTHETCLAQTGHIPKTSPHHSWQENGSCSDCGATRNGVTCIATRPHRNLCDVRNQVYASFCLQLGSVWGFRVNQWKVDIIEEYAKRKRAATIGPFLEVGLIREDGSENRSDLKKRIAVAYGSYEMCPVCSGTGRVGAPNPKMLRCPDCKGRSAPWKSGGTIKEPTVKECVRCTSSGKIVDVRHTVTCCGPEEEVTCDGTGLLLSPSTPRADKEGIAYGADSLHESGDDFLVSYGDFGEDGKWLKDYIPYMRLGRQPVAEHYEDCLRLTTNMKKGCTCPGPYEDIPLTLRSNSLLETGRVSFRGYIMLLPRWPGFIDKQTGQYIPSFRECFEPMGFRYDTVEVPDDYKLQPGEFKC